MEIIPPDGEAEAERTLAKARRRATLILILVFWAFAVLMLTVRAEFVDIAPLATIAPRRLLAAFVGALLCLALARMLELLRGRRFATRVVCGLLGALAMAVALTAVTMTLNRIVFPLPGTSFSIAESAQWAMVWFGYLLAWTGTQLAMTYHWESVGHQRRALLLAELTRDAQRAALRYQLNPHFLFNTLNSISALVGEARNEDAEAMLISLAGFVRATLGGDPSGTITLREEVALQQLYLAIERIRFEERLTIAVDVPDELAEVRVPALILQPLVENAVRHGVERAEAPLSISIAAAARGELVEVTVEDDGAAATQAGGGGGVGLANVAARLRAHFGASGRLDAGPLATQGYRATVHIPRRAG